MTSGKSYHSVRVSLSIDKEALVVKFQLSTMLLNHLNKKYSASKQKRKDLTNVPYGKGKQLLHGLLEISIFEAKGLPDMDGKDTPKFF